MRYSKASTAQDVEVSISTLSCTLHQLAITLAKEAVERNEHLRATWQVNMAEYDPRQIAFKDPTSACQEYFNFEQIRHGRGREGAVDLAQI
jgi:hypothetical protein